MRKVFLIALLSLMALPPFAQADGTNEAETIAHAHRAFDACKSSKGAHIVDDGRTVCLSGDIEPPMFLSLISNKDKIKDDVEVVISSYGGYINSSLDIVELLNPFHPTTVVGDACASSCAQFLLLMGDRHVAGSAISKGGGWSPSNWVIAGRHPEIAQSPVECRLDRRFLNLHCR